MEPLPNENSRRILFIHKGSSEKNAPRILVMPMGLIALADHLADNGFETQVLNLEIEKALDPDFDIVRYIKANRFGIVCFDLFWHFQTRAVIATAKKIKSRLKNVRTVLGGFTAGCFDAEILGRFPWIDFVIRGDAETPLLDLVRRITGDDLPELARVPNLSWRSSGRVRRNPQTYTTPQRTFDLLDYASFGRVRHHDLCSARNLLSSKTSLALLGRRFRRAHNGRPPRGSRSIHIPGWDRVFFFNCGRGCRVDCSFCGGGRSAQQEIYKRNGILLMGVTSALRQLQEAARFGFTWWVTAFFPRATETYYRKLFGKIRKAGLKLKTSFYCCDLPSREFIDEFRKTFSPDSKLEIAPLSGSERVRKTNKGYYYDTDRFLRFLTYLSERKMLCSITFTAGLSFETEADIKKTLLLIRCIRRFFPQFEIVVEQTTMEPEAPWFLNKKKYGIASGAGDFSDFYADRTRPINYCTKELGKRKILAALDILTACARAEPPGPDPCRSA